MRDECRREERHKWRRRRSLDEAVRGAIVQSVSRRRRRTERSGALRRITRLTRISALLFTHTFGDIHSILPQPFPPVCLVFGYRRPPRRQVELGAGGRRDDRCRKNKKMRNGGGGERGKEVTARPAHHTHTCPLAPGRGKWGRDTPVPLGKLPLEGRREGRTGRRRGGEGQGDTHQLVAAQVAHCVGYTVLLTQSPPPPSKCYNGDRVMPPSILGWKKIPPKINSLYRTPSHFVRFS